MAANIALKTFKGGNVTPQDDAIIHETSIPGAGIFRGCEVSYARGNVLHISQGFGMIRGRFFEMYETEVPVRLADTGQTLNGRIYLHMDLSNADEPIKIMTETAVILSTLMADNNVNYNNSSYDLELANFTVSSTELTDLIQVFSLLKGGSGGGGGVSLERSVNYSLGDMVSNGSAPGWATLYCTQAGTTGVVEPMGYVKITKVGDKVLDGTAVFTARNIIGELDGSLSTLTKLDNQVDALTRQVESVLSNSGNLTIKMTALTDYRALAEYDSNVIYMCYEDANTQKITRIYLGENKIYSDGVKVTYQIDTDYVLSQIVEDGADAVKTAPPVTLNGYEFIGWRQDNTADAKVLKELIIATDEPFSLYAVFIKQAEVSFFASGGTGDMENIETGVLYNNGNAYGESTILPECSFKKTGYAFIGWTSDTLTEPVLPGSTADFSEDAVLYANWIQEKYEFVFTGSYFEFIVPANGVYNLDVFGGQGGSVEYQEQTAKGGKGGHSNGYAYLTKGTKLYIAIGGGAPKVASVSYGNYGYNGGSSGSSYATTNTSYPQSINGGGGGCTHIGTKAGDLKSVTYASLATVLIVAGGGGGASLQYAKGVSNHGGAGGGENGENGSGGALAGRQTSNSAATTSLFGYGESTNYSYGYAGGGGGLYGGSVGQGGQSGAGGSGYIGGVPSFSRNKKYYPATTEQGKNEGNGKATITYVACV
ncbi:putative repeat protein (TIGR02543 family) [Kineothrix alysoides]|uniref:receptor protein-tyrosine kinase n=1 Tax=Kineothrix alysoides TaxID=1469948 RepID=A0A4R1R5L2_9FIRM|nr:glycine-rich protein [Kineothrix alysoides]TCL60582.1 putative repeat protein (TIGR02543 family) [Kineothrix alysoides]